jgi:hypothetical protein
MKRSLDDAENIVLLTNDIYTELCKVIDSPFFTDLKSFYSWYATCHAFYDQYKKKEFEELHLLMKEKKERQRSIGMTSLYSRDRVYYIRLTDICHILDIVLLMKFQLRTIFESICDFETFEDPYLTVCKIATLSALMNIIMKTETEQSPNYLLYLLSVASKMIENVYGWSTILKTGDNTLVWSEIKSTNDVRILLCVKL